MTRMVLIIPPLIQLVVFSFAATLEVKEVPIAVLNRDSGKASQELIYRFEGSRYFPAVYRLNSPAQVKDYIDTMKVPMVIEINDDFSAKYYSGQPAEIQLVLDGRKTNVSQILAGYAGAIVNDYNRENSPQKNIIMARNWFNENLDYRLYTVPCIIGLITTLLGLIVTSLAVAREREFGTFDQLLVSPLAPIEIFIGKAVPAFVFAIMEGTFMLIAALLIFQVPFKGSVILFYVSMIVYLLSIIGVGLLISSMSKTQQQAILGTFVFMVPAILLSGYATPVENMPEWLQAVSVIDPTQHYMYIIKGIMLKNMPFSATLRYLIPIAVIAVVSLAISIRMFKQRLE
jgi:ABC-2 type transport system permease protein